MRHFRLPWWPATPQADDSLSRQVSHHLGLEMIGSGFVGGVAVGVLIAAVVLYLWAQGNCQDVTGLAQIASAFSGHNVSGHVVACRTP